MTKKFLLAVAAAALVLSLGADCAWAQSLTLNVADTPTGSATARIFNLIALITVLSIAPSILVMMTSFTRIVVVFSITRSALATNTTPPNMVLISLALFLTMFIMAPTFEKSWEQWIKPMFDDQIEMMDGLEKEAEPIKGFAVVYRSGAGKACGIGCGNAVESGYSRLYDQRTAASL